MATDAIFTLVFIQASDRSLFALPSLLAAKRGRPAATGLRMASQAALMVVGHSGSRLRDGMRIMARDAAHLPTGVAAAGDHLFDLADGPVTGRALGRFDKNRPEQFPRQARTKIVRFPTGVEDAHL